MQKKIIHRMLGPTYDWCSGVYGSRIPYTPLDHYISTKSALDPTYGRRILRSCDCAS